MTDALYLSDSYQTEAKGKIIELGETGDKQAYIILDQTIMYPMGGGQPSDKGTISSKNGSILVKQVDYNHGNIKHIGKLAGELKAGDEVTISIDWPTRYEHMQLHTAGHVLDLVARELYPDLIPTRGMHGIGKKLFIEYEGIKELDTTKLNQSIQSLIDSNVKISTEFTTLDELKKKANWLPEHLPTSKKLRVLSIGEAYHIPDGGTQLKNSSELWPTVVTEITHEDGLTQIHYQVTKPQEKVVIQEPTNMSTEKNNTDVAEVRSLFVRELESIQTSAGLEALRAKYLSKKHGIVTDLMSDLQGLALSAKKEVGPALNSLKSEIEESLGAKQLSLKANISKLEANKIDLTIPASSQHAGHLHPTTQIIREMNQFFRYHGFSVGEGPEIEEVEYNFRRLNLPEGHPATDLQDSLYIHEPNILLRTHTSSIETRILSTNTPPLRVVAPGKCYRNETNNSTNSSFFYQYQGFVVDKGITIQHLKDTLTKFHQFLFGDDVILRFRYKYYPEVSPSMGVDMQCRFCKGEGCSVCKYRGFIEVLGSGMIHSNTLRACGIDPEIYSGYAFGMGLDRLVMSKFGISDIRKLYGGEIVYK